MREWLLIVGIALANNLDNTGVGIAYGLARIRLPLPVNLWISVITLLVTGASVALGAGVGHFVPASLSRALSALILCGIGLWVLLPALSRRRGGAVPGDALRRVLADPPWADRDGSRHIDLREGTLLGLALSLNNVGGGISAGLIHLNVLWTGLLSAVVSFLVLWLGGVAGRRLGGGRLGEYAQVAAGVLLIVIGLCQLT